MSQAVFDAISQEFDRRQALRDAARKPYQGLDETARKTGPYVTWTLLSAAPEHSFDRKIEEQRWSCRVETGKQRPKQCSDAMEAIIDAFEPDGVPHEFATTEILHAVVRMVERRGPDLVEDRYVGEITFAIGVEWR